MQLKLESNWSDYKGSLENYVYSHYILLNTWSLGDEGTATRSSPGIKETQGAWVYPELVRTQLVDVRAGPGHRLIPEAELQEQLVPAGQKHLSPLLPVIHKLLHPAWHRSHSRAQGGHTFRHSHPLAHSKCTLQNYFGSGNNSCTHLGERYRQANIFYLKNIQVLGCDLHSVLKRSDISEITSSCCNPYFGHMLMMV